ncbi:MAG: hypothetical protein IKT56_05390 [Clostridia bacterium]|nr:hypothetical protein [Clostridia bacterium]
MSKKSIRINFDFGSTPKKNIKDSKKMAICAIFAALSVVIMYIGALIEVLDISMATIASMFCVITLIEIGGAYPWLVFAVTGAISVLILPQKFAALIYVCIAGYYPMLKCIYERITHRYLEWILKLLTFNAAITVLVLLASFVFSLDGMTRGYIIALYALGNFTFVVYDVALTMLIRLYFLKYRKMFRIDKILK